MGAGALTTVGDIYQYLDRFAPFSTQLEWDNAGLLLGSFEQEVRRAVVCLDVGAGHVATQTGLPVDLVVSHHPVLFHARKQFTNPREPAMALLRQGCAAIAFHTNYDICPGGMNDSFAARLGLQSVQALPCGARVGLLPRSMDALHLAEFVSHSLGVCGSRVPVRYCLAGGTIRRVAVCSGGGCSLLSAIYGLAEAYVTGDAEHHDFLEAAQQGVSLLAAGHYHTEIIGISPLCERLRGAFPQVEWECFESAAHEQLLPGSLFSLEEG
jgi:dinuclear metal center YbgI/SA1388 family protein